MQLNANNCPLLKAFLLCRSAIGPGEAPYIRVKSIFLVDRAVSGHSSRSHAISPCCPSHYLPPDLLWKVT